MSLEDVAEGFLKTISSEELKKKIKGGSFELRKTTVRHNKQKFDITLTAERDEKAYALETPLYELLDRLNALQKHQGLIVEVELNLGPSSEINNNPLLVYRGEMTIGRTDTGYSFITSGENPFQSSIATENQWGFYESDPKMKSFPWDRSMAFLKVCGSPNVEARLFGYEKPKETEQPNESSQEA
jgi:hypothetical protein